jgi:hypothetical protein
MKQLFTERHGGTKPRVSETLDATARNALWNLLSARIDEEWFGFLFPNKCGDGYHTESAGSRLGANRRKCEAGRHSGTYSRSAPSTNRECGA